MHSEIPIAEKNIAPRTFKTAIDTTVSSHSKAPLASIPNTKTQIHKWLRNTILITGESMILSIDGRRISEKHPMKVCPFSGV